MASASIIYNLRAASITGINGKLFKQVYDNFVDLRIKPRLVDIYYDAISPVINIKNRDEMKTPLQVLKPEGKVLIHPFAGWREKEWSFRNFIKLADSLKNEYHLSLLIPSGQISYDVLQEIEYAQIEVIQTSNVEDLIHNIQECTLFIGNDSGPTNIANFVGRPTLTIYSATNPDYTATTNEHQIYLQKILNCSAGSNEKFCIIGGDLYNCPGIQCMNLVTFDQVHEQVISLLRKYCNRKNENSKVN
jgi:ADP-heptose:LPS heptosyltransferase